MSYANKNLTVKFCTGDVTVSCCDVTEHRAVTGHLIKQRRDGVVAAVEDYQQRRNFGLPEVEQLVLLRDDLLTTNRKNTAD